MVNQETINLIEHYEGLRLAAYLDTAGIPTIGYGTTHYPNENAVKLGDQITPQQALVYFTNDLNNTAEMLQQYVTSKLNDNQLGALASFTYNEGIGRLKTSTLLKKVNANPLDSTIKQEFERWDISGGKVTTGLLNRRIAEATLYFK